MREFWCRGLCFIVGCSGLIAAPSVGTGGTPGLQGGLGCRCGMWGMGAKCMIGDVGCRVWDASCGARGAFG